MLNERLPSPIELYLDEAKYRLRHHLPPGQMYAAIAEAQNHLEQRTEAFVESGMSIDDAETEAIKAFGPAREWATEVVDAFYSNKRSANFARLIKYCFIAVAIASLWIALMSVNNYQAEIDVTILAFLACFTGAMLVLVGSYQHRKILSKSIIASFVMIPCFSIAIVGLCTVNVDGVTYLTRTEAIKYLDHQRSKIPVIKSELHLLKLGKRVYLDSKPIGSVPASLITSNGYIFPHCLPDEYDGLTYSELPKGDTDCRTMYTIPTHTAFQDDGYPYLADNIAKGNESAAYQWKWSNVSDWISHEEAWTSPKEEAFIAMRVAEVSRPSFNAKILPQAMISVYLVATAIILHILGVWLGRLFYRTTFRSKTALPA